MDAPVIASELDAPAPDAVPQPGAPASDAFDKDAPALDAFDKDAPASDAFDENAPAPVPASTASDTGDKADVGARAFMQKATPLVPRALVAQAPRAPATARDLLHDMPLLLMLPVVALAGLVFVLAALVRTLLKGEVDWTSQLVSRTDWSQLPAGVVKCAGTCEPVDTLASPLAGAPCVAYRVSVAYEDKTWVTCAQESQAATFMVRDTAGRGLLVTGKECHPYRLDHVKEWCFPSAEVPEPFASWVPADVASRGLPLRFREEALLPGSRVGCVGALSALRSVVGDETHGCLRPAYAVMLAQGQKLDWAQLVDLGPAEWTQLAARVLVTNST